MEQAGIALIEVLDPRDGSVRTSHKGPWPMTVGRALACDVVLNDPHLAGEHLRVHWDGAQARLELCPSMNGVRLRDRAWQGVRMLEWAAGDVLHLGQSMLRLRTSTQALAPELPLPYGSRSAQSTPPRWWVLVGLCLLWTLTLFVEHWLSSSPETRWVEWVSALLVPLCMVAGWAGLWTLLTQLFRHQQEWRRHLRGALLALVLLWLMDTSTEALAYILSWPWLLSAQWLMLTAMVSSWVWWHATLVWPRWRLTLGLVAVLLAGLVSALTLGKKVDPQHWLRAPYVGQLLPPALQLRQPSSVDAFVGELGALEATLQEKAQRDRDDADEEPEGD
ncbi:FHA domain-containing protein [Roseateles sp. BYS180W]|uniref:FHA domain-containing protein n=1 Tax=Roseateles rivi TaxID=3299028 RepID=A0ABW7FRN4_9BURK